MLCNVTCTISICTIFMDILLSRTYEIKLHMNTTDYKHKFEDMPNNYGYLQQITKDTWINLLPHNIICLHVSLIIVCILKFYTRTNSVQENARTNSCNKELDSFPHSHKCAICHGNTQHAMDIQHILLY